MGSEQTNLHALRRGADAWDARDREGWLDAFSTDVEYIAALDDQPRRGRQELGGLWDTWWSALSQIRRRDYDCRAAGEWVLQLSNVCVRVAASGITLDQPIGWVYRFENGLAVWAHQYRDADAARAEFDRVTGDLEPLVERL
jgi:ketosteroid isomerase-like protein